MISHLTGTLLLLDIRYAIIDVNGVGYKVSITGEVVEKLSHSLNTTVSLHTYLAVRETALDLYGFMTASDLEMFEYLLTVSGIGPKSALGVLNIANANTVREAVTSGDISYLTKVSGIGKKTAEKIILELKGKLGDETEMLSGGKDAGIAIEGLKALGYSEREARDAIKDMPKDMSPEALLKEALKKLGS